MDLASKTARTCLLIYYLAQKLSNCGLEGSRGKYIFLGLSKLTVKLCIYCKTKHTHIKNTYKLK